MGFSLKKVTSAVKSAVSNPGNALKKVAVTAVAAGTGFVTGGPAGAVGGAVAGAVKASKTGKAPALNLRTGYQTAILGGVAGAASGIAAKTAPSLLKSAATVGKSGGLITKTGALVKSVSGMGGKVAGLMSSFSKNASTGGTPEDSEAGSGSELGIGNRLTEDVSRSLSDSAVSATRSGLGRLKTSVGKTAQKFGIDVPGTTPGEPRGGTLNGGTTGGGTSEGSNITIGGNPLQAGMGMDMGAMMLPALAIGAFFLLTGKKG